MSLHLKDKGSELFGVMNRALMYRIRTTCSKVLRNKLWVSDFHKKKASDSLKGSKFRNLSSLLFFAPIVINRQYSKGKQSACVYTGPIYLHADGQIYMHIHV